MARPLSDEGGTMVSCRVQPTVRAQIRQLARERGCTISDVVREIISAAVGQEQSDRSERTARTGVSAVA